MVGYLALQSLLVTCLDVNHVACYKKVNENVIRHDPYFDKWVAEFEVDVGVSAYKIPIKFNVLQNNVIGKCVRSSEGNHIEIDRMYWNTNHKYARKALLYHEIGHCVLGRGHNDHTYKGIALSLMHSISQPHADYIIHFNAYNIELRTGKTEYVKRSINKGK